MTVMRIMALLVFVSGGLAAIGYHQVVAVQEDAVAETEIENHRSRLGSARARFDAERSALASAIREEVRLAHPGLDEPSVGDIAGVVVLVSEKYPRVDPVLLASIGIVDSRGDPDSAARGLYRLYPAAARRLAKELGWEYGEDLRRDPARTAELAARHLDRLNRAYNDVEMKLAEYNGGPLNAGYLRAEVSRLSNETERYVPQVLEVYGRLASRLPSRGPDGEPPPLDVRRARTLADAAGGF